MNRRQLPKTVLRNVDLHLHRSPASHRTQDARRSAVGTRHQSVSLKIASSLLRHVESGNLGQVLHAPCDVILSRNFVIQPDIFFVQQGRSGLVGKRNLIGAPDVVVEVLSDSSRERDLRVKRNIYSRFEVKEYWIADPDAESIEVLLWSEMGYATKGIYGKSDRVSTPALPRLRMPVSEVFGSNP